MLETPARDYRKNPTPPDISLTTSSYHSLTPATHPSPSPYQCGHSPESGLSAKTLRVLLRGICRRRAAAGGDRSRPVPRRATRRGANGRGATEPAAGAGLHSTRWEVPRRHWTRRLCCAAVHGADTRNGRGGSSWKRKEGQGWMGEWRALRGLKPIGWSERVLKVEGHHADYR